MIAFQEVWKEFRLPGGGRKTVLGGMTLSLPRRSRIAVIGRNGAGKSPFLRLVSGVTQPDRGEITRSGKVSWPMGFSGGVHPALTGRQNARFIARVYGVDTDDLVSEVEDFAELGPFFDAPVAAYSSGMRARLALGISLAASFDCYLVDEITAVGDAAFRKKAHAAITDKLRDTQLFMVSHSEATLREYCTSALLLAGGAARYFDRLEDGLAHYRESAA